MDRFIIVKSTHTDTHLTVIYLHLHKTKVQQPLYLWSLIQKTNKTDYVAQTLT